jgi:hypothetical protein
MVRKRMKMKETKENIDYFFTWVENQRKEIDTFLDPFRRILLLALLDTLSKCALPNERGNRKRFVKFIDDYSLRENKDRVSLTQVRLLLKKTKCPFLQNWANDKINKWTKGRILHPDETDPFSHELDHMKCEECDEAISKAQYASLLWQMRNFSVHEFRHLGQGWGFSNDNSTPYYHGSKNGNFSSWELYIPSEVVSQIVQRCAANLKAQLATDNKNPYDSFPFGSSWY